MATQALLLLVLTAALTVTEAQNIGICYGRDANNLPSPAAVVAQYRSRGIGRMRIYDPNQAVLQALRGSNIELLLGLPNTDLQSVASDTAAAARWVETNVRAYFPDVRIKYVVVGNEVSPVNWNSQYTSFLVPAMTNIYNAMLAVGLIGQIRVTTTFEMGVIGTSFPPSAGAFRGDVMGLMNPVIGFLVDTRAPILFNLYPYFSHIGSSSISLNYALFRNAQPEFIDSGNNLPYQNLFDAMLDACYAALARANGGSLEIVVSESGWPSAGGTATTLDNAGTYVQSLIRHVSGGSPRRRLPIELYLFAMFNENLKSPDYERNFGLFYPNQQPVYPLNFFNSVSDM